MWKLVAPIIAKPKNNDNLQGRFNVLPKSDLLGPLL